MEISKSSAFIRMRHLALVLLAPGGLFAAEANPQDRDRSEAPLPPLALLRPAQRVVRGERLASSSRGAVQSQMIDVEFAALDPQRDELRLDLFGGKSWIARRQSIEVRGAHDYSWRGRIEGEPGHFSDVILSVKQGALAAMIYTPDGEVYEIRTAPGGSTLTLLNQDRFLGCGEPLHPPAQDEIVTPRFAATATAEGDGTVDLLVVYTDDARAVHGQAGIESTIQSAVDLSNTAYQNSGINMRLRLVGTREVDYAEAGNASADLDWVTNDAAVASVRDELGADVVSFMVNQSDYCGLGWLMSNVGAGFAPYAFNVVLTDCAAGNITLAHEIGHNEGADHDPGNSGNSAPFSYAHGHFIDGKYRTVMSYSSLCTGGCPKAPYFSNPAVSYMGHPTGVAGERDNHLALNNTVATVSAFRAASSSLLLAPPNFRLVKRSTKSLTVAWDDISSAESGYRIYRWNGTDWVTHMEVPADTVLAKVAGLKKNKRYSLTITTFDAGGESVAGGVVNARTKK